MASVRKYSNANALARAAADLFLDLCSSATQERGRFSVALSGGSTPAALFRLLATENYASSIDWSGVHVFWGDERNVAPEHINSNYRMANDTLLRLVPIPGQNINRILGEIHAGEAAKAYEAALRDFFGGEVPQFDLILLGMGDDGHTASLFPGSVVVGKEVAGNQLDWVAPNYVEKLGTWRITLTTCVINAAANVLFLVSGSTKAETVRSVLEGPYQPATLPAQLIKPKQGRLIWLVDEQAAAYLSAR